MFDCLPRPMSDIEQKVLSHYLDGSRRVDSNILIGQIPYATVIETHISTLDLSVDATQAESTDIEVPGPLQPRVFAIGPDGKIWGEVLVWVTNGYLSGLGLAWWNDDLACGWESVEATAYEWELPPGS